MIEPCNFSSQNGSAPASHPMAWSSLTQTGRTSRCRCVGWRGGCCGCCDPTFNALTQTQGIGALAARVGNSSRLTKRVSGAACVGAFYIKTMSPFSKDYRPHIDSETISRDAKTSRTATANRAKNMQSACPLTRLTASGNLGEMSAKINHKLAKNSKLG